MRIANNKEEAMLCISELESQNAVIDIDIITRESNQVEIERLKSEWQLQ